MDGVVQIQASKQTMITKMPLMSLFFTAIMSFGYYQVSMASNCIKQERESLLKLKATFIESSNQLGSWNGTDCCSWDGIGCDPTNGHVVKLDLRNYGYSFSSALRANGVDSSLFELKHLNHLDLSGNCFNHTHIPNDLSSMLQLRYLNLSLACFTGTIPRVLGNLTKLRFLDFNSDYVYRPGYYDDTNMYTDDLGWVSSLSSLEYLDLSWVNVRSNFVQLLNSLPNSLFTLKLRGCDLQNNYHIVSPQLNSSFVSKLQHLDLSYNMFDGPIFTFLPNMTSLRFLNLSFNNFNSSIPLWMGKMNLVELNLGYNPFTSFEGGLSSIIRNNRHLKKFSLSNNRFLRGDVFGSHENSSLGYSAMENLNLEEIKFGAYTIPNWLGQLKNLKFLNLRSNLLYGPIPSSFGNLSSLENMDISHNMLTGGIPNSFGKLSNLLSLNLRENNLDEVKPESLGQLQSLKNLDFSNNALKCVISEIHFVNLSRLESLRMANNRLLSFEMKHNWVPPFQLDLLDLGSTKGFGTTEFPWWIGTQRVQLSYLNLSDTNIVGPMPTWLNFQLLGLLDLSYNQINGSLPTSIDEQMPNLVALYISDAHIGGSLPQSLCRLKNLMLLAVSNNGLSGTIPNCLSTLDLNILDLSYNKFSGVLPSSFQNLSNLKLLNLTNNQLEGQPLTTMRSFKSLSVLDLEGNEFSGNIPTWVGHSLVRLQILNLRDNMFNGTIPSTLWVLPRLQILILAENKFVGNIPPNVGNFSERSRPITENWLLCNSAENPYALCYGGGYTEQVVKSSNMNYSYLRLYSMVNIDLSNNRLYGQIPSEMTTIKGLYGLNLSHNNLSGTIPVEIGRSVSLESLDLSFNKLYGPIPNNMSSLSSLGVLKLSNNNFSGRIPREGHLSTFNDASSYEGNPYLCGEPLYVKCPNENYDESLAEVDNFGDNGSYEEDKLEKMWFYIFVMVGYGLGFWGVVGTLILKRRWWRAYFEFMDETMDWIHVAILVNMTRLKPQMRGNKNINQ